jgi:parallel beta-helix repeat protein
MKLTRLLLICGVAFLPVIPLGVSASESEISLQALIDAAAPGAVISVPAGTYQGQIVLKDGVALVGEGADVTTLDGNGADVVVRGARNAILLGFTIRNGGTAVKIDQTSMGIFECAVRDFQKVAVEVARGCAVIANNLIEGGPSSTGVLCFTSNPYLTGNIIVSNAVGVYVWQQSSPSLANNVFVGNSTAILVGAESSAFLESNVFDQNAQNIVGQSLGTSDTVRAVALDGKVPHRGGSVESYRKLTELVLEKKLFEHPVVIYDLRNELGRFGMTVLSPWASFTISASTPDTEIVDHRAFDTATDKALRDELVRLALPTVAVINQEIKDMAPERFVLHCSYAHPSSYFRNEQGQLVFRRLTNITRVEIVVPSGYTPISVNYPAKIEEDEGCRVVKITEVGAKQIEVVMSP